MGIEKIYVGTQPKEKILEQWIGDMNIGYNQVAYIGDDINDKVIMEKCGFSACPSDAVEKIKKISQVVLENSGGHCCVREFIEKYILGKLL